MDRFRFGWRGAAGAGFLLSCAVLALSETLLRPDHEILYDDSLRPNCHESRQGRRCAAMYQLAIASSGRAAHEELQVEWGARFEGRWGYAATASDLVASRAPTATPATEWHFSAGRTQLRIRNFAPNTVLDVRVNCLDCTPEEVRELRDGMARVQARGTVTKTDPRATVYGRAIRNLARIAGLFR